MNVLFTSVGRRSYLLRYFKDAIGEFGGEIHAANSDGRSTALNVADKSVVTPLIYDARYIDFLLEYCESHQIGLLMSLFDVDLPKLEQARGRFEEIGTRVLVSNGRFLRVCNDKYSCARYLMEHGFDVPNTALSLGEYDDFGGGSGFDLPLVVKPRWGMGSIGVYVCTEEDELPVIGHRVLREVARSYLKYESGETPGESVLYQKHVDGIEFGLDVINDLSGRHVVTIVKEKLAMRSGETDVARVVSDERLGEIGRKLGSISGHIGNLDVDVIRTEEGRCHIIDMNARFGGHYPFSHLAGANLPRAILHWAHGREAPAECFQVRCGTMGAKEIVPVIL